MAATNKSYSSFDTNDFIDLDTALVEEELRSLGPTPDHVQRDYSTSQSPFRFSLKSIDEKETERFRRSLVTPLSRYNTPEWRSRSKSPTGSYAESVALFKNLSNNNDHLDLVSSDFNDFMNSYDDDLMSRQENAAYLNQEEVYHHRQSANTPFLQKLSQNKTREKLPSTRYTERLPESKPRKSSFDASVQTSGEYILPTELKTKKSTPALTQRRLSSIKPTEQLHKDMERLVLNKRQSVDSDALRRLKEQQKKEETKIKRHSTLISSRPRLVDTSTKLKSPLQSNNIKLNVPQKSIINPTTQRSSLQQPDKRRWSSYIPDDSEYLQKEKKIPQRHQEPEPPKQSRLSRNLTEQTDARQSAYARRRHTLSNGPPKEEPIPRYRESRLLDEKQRYNSESLPSRHYTLKTTIETNKPRRHVPQEVPVVYYDDEKQVEPPRRHRTLSNPHERHRKLSNNSKYREDYKEVRFQPEEIVASTSSGLLSSSTTSSSHSGDLYYDPPSPPKPVAQNRRSVPVMDTQLIDEQVRATENRYSQYLSRRKQEAYLHQEEQQEQSQYLPRRKQEAYVYQEVQQEESQYLPRRKQEIYVKQEEQQQSQYLPRRKQETYVHQEEQEEYVPRRQRVVSEDNENYKYQLGRRKSLKQPLSPSQIPVNTTRNRLYHASSTEDVTESARKVLALVQQRRQKSMLPSNYPRRRDIYYH